MLLDISVALRNPGEVYNFSTEIAMEPQNIYGQTYNIDSVIIDSIYTANEGEVYFSGKVSFDITTQCARCLNNVKEHVSTDFSEIFSSSAINVGEIQEKYDYNILLDGYNINVTQFVHQVVIANIPLKIICQNGCKNTTLYIDNDNNHDSLENNPFLILKNVFNNDEEV